MKLTKASWTLGLMSLAVLASPLAMADDEGWYLGGNVGQSAANIDDEKITESLAGGGFANTSLDEDDRDFGYKLFTGYQFNRYFAFEAGYFDLGEFGFTATTNPAGTLSGEMKVQGVNLDAVGILPFTDRFAAFARVGANYAETKSSFSGTGAVPVPADSNFKDTDWNPKVGLGLEYDLTESWSARLEAERYRVSDAVGNKGDIDLASLGLVYRFGQRPEPRVIAAAPPPPEPVYVPPPPPPRPPPPPPPKRVTFSADALFDFDSAVLRPEGKRTLDAFGAELRDIRYDLIKVTGHTDRIGSDAYNMRLSTRRAESVRDYLVDSAGVPAGKMVGRGAGEHEPVTKPGECREDRSAATIACLQPDRRVEVEVTGTK